MHADYQLDSPGQAVLAGLLITITATTAIIAFLLAARGQNRTVATVALIASGALTPAVFVANIGLGLVVSDSGSQDDPVQGWQSGTWVLLLGGPGCCWIATVLRDHFER